MIMGCDGRKIEEDTYFWAHDQASQLNDLMGDIKQAHPAFFKIDYNDYYFKHCETLEMQLSELHAKGYAVENLTPSNIPSLQKRTSNLKKYNYPAYAKNIIKNYGIDLNSRRSQEIKNMDLSNKEISDGTLIYISCLIYIEELILSNTSITGLGLKNIGNLKNLKKLNLANTKIGNQDLNHLLCLYNLEDLSLTSTGINDLGCKILANLKKLRFLSLRSTQISNRGLKYLNKLPILESLNLMETNISHAGLKHLLINKNLKVIKVKNTRIKKSQTKGINKLRLIY